MYRHVRMIVNVRVHCDDFLSYPARMQTHPAHVVNPYTITSGKYDREYEQHRSRLPQKPLDSFGMPDGDGRSSRSCLFIALLPRSGQIYVALCP